MTCRTQSASPYMQFAKLRSEATYNLASSGILKCSLSDLPVKLEDLEINGPTLYGYAPLKERIAKLNGVTPEQVVCATGTSMANHLAFAATLEPGDEVLVERPTYELLTSTLQYLGARIRYFDRHMSDEFRVDAEEIARQMTPQTRMIVLTNLHNPSSVLIDEAILIAVGEIARRHNAYVLVDEVYLEAMYEQRPRSAIHLGEHFLVTSSLTKAYGLSGLRCGWVLAAPEIVNRMNSINDLYGVNAAHPAELLSVIAFDHLDCLTARAKKLLASNRPMLDSFLESRDDIACVRLEFGTIAFPKLLHRSVQDLDHLLREKYDTSVVPGRFFDMPQHFRIGIGGDPANTLAAFERLGKALDELR